MAWDNMDTWDISWTLAAKTVSKMCLKLNDIEMVKKWPLFLPGNFPRDTIYRTMHVQTLKWQSKNSFISNRKCRSIHIGLIQQIIVKSQITLLNYEPNNGFQKGQNDKNSLDGLFLDHNYRYQFDMQGMKSFQMGWCEFSNTLGFYLCCTMLMKSPQ